MELHRLARRQSYGAVGDRRRDLVQAEPLLGRESTARHDDADHEDVVQRFAGQSPGAANVALVLGVDPVELEQLFAIVRDVR